MVDIVDIALCVSRLLLYNNFKRGVMSRNQCLVNVPCIVLVPRFSIALYYWSDNVGYFDYRF